MKIETLIAFPLPLNLNKFTVDGYVLRRHQIYNNSTYNITVSKFSENCALILWFFILSCNILNFEKSDSVFF